MLSTEQAVVLSLYFSTLNLTRNSDCGVEEPTFSFKGVYIHIR